tara:strand:- start:73 stop:459 length:387 start_codon:yes stop_codon:yes gene_type:complete
MPIKLKSFATVDYYHICGMHLKRFVAGVKGNVKIDYHHPHGVMVYRDEKTPEFVPIHNIKIITPENIEDLQEALGDSPERSVENLKDSGFAVTLVDKDNSTIVDGPIPKKKRKRRTKAEMEAARVAAS